MPVPTTEIASRLKKLRAILRREKLGAIFLNEKEDVHYFSGFLGDDSSVLITAKKEWLITDGRFTEEAAHSAPCFEMIHWQKGHALFAGELAKKARTTRLGFSSGTLSVAWHKDLRKGARGCILVAADEIPRAIRSIKSSWEVRQIQKALRCAEAAFLALRERLQPGMSELDIRSELEFGMRKRGASDAAFESIIACDANASLPHAHAGKRKLKNGGLLLIDWGAHLGRYNSDLTRVLFMGGVSAFWRQRYTWVLDAQLAGIAKIASGVSCREPDQAARKIFAAADCEKFYTHSLGHGLGLAVHEMPGLSVRSKATLEEGMIVTVEPGLYYPKRGGIRIEDDILVTKTGNRKLSKLPKDLEWAVI